MKAEIDRILSRSEGKLCTPNGAPCTSKTIGPLVRRHIVAAEFRYIGKEASTRWADSPDVSMMSEAGVLAPMDETLREYIRVVDPKYLDEIRAAAKQFSTKLLSRKSAVAECAIRSFKNGKNTVEPRTLRKTLTRAIHDLQTGTCEGTVSAQLTLCESGRAATIMYARRFRRFDPRKVCSTTNDRTIIYKGDDRRKFRPD